MRIDQIMLENLTDAKQLGLYSAALKLSESWFFLAGAITNSYYPSIAFYWLNNNHEFYRKYIKLLTNLLKISIFVAFLITLLGNPLVNFLFGNQYGGVGDILIIHVWTGVPIFLGIGCTNLFILKNLQKYSIIRSGLGAVLNIVLNISLIPKFGAIGASIATLISQIFASYLINIIIPQTREIFYIQTKSIIKIFNLK
jgi:PST family polysaccharide transporter